MGMKKLNRILLSALFSLIVLSCTSFEDVKEISGTLIFNEIGTHSFSINAENIEATITMVGPNKGETFIFEHVKLSRTANYTAKIGVNKSSNVKTELFNNLVVMYEARSGSNIQNISDSGYVKIDWKGFD
jgi:hypothetical protein